MTAVLILIIGFLLLVKGADFFVEGASDIAKKLGIPSIVIGLTIVALGTSLPELAVSVTAALKGSNDIALGNVTGSNIMNLLIVVGVSAVIRPIRVDRSVMKRDYTMSLFMTVLMLICSGEIFLGGQKAVISRLDGVILLAVMFFYMYRLIRGAVRNRVAEQFGISRPLPLSFLFCILGAAAIIGGGQLVVNSATELAYRFGMSETLVGLTIVAIGTSLPELVTSVVAARKGESDIALGNVMGSNILNIGFILGLSGAIHPISVGLLNLFDMLVLIGITVLFFFPLWKQGKVSRITGVMMIGCYIIYTGYIIIR